MANDYYSGESDSNQADMPADDTASESTEKPDNESSEGETALVSDSFFPSECKVGDSYTVKVVAQHEGEKEIEFVSSDKEEANEPAPDTMDSRMDKMANA